VRAQRTARNAKKRRNRKNSATRRLRGETEIQLSTFRISGAGGGIGIPKLIENTYVIEFSTRSKRSYIRNCARLERIWNPRIQELHEFSDAPPARAANPRISWWCYPVRNTSMNSRLLVCLSKMPRVQRPDARIISCPRHFRSSLATIRQSWSQRGSESRNGPNTDASLNAFRRRLSEFGKGQSHSKAFCPPHTSENWWVQ
jgi:hypothetical protein